MHGQPGRQLRLAPAAGQFGMTAPRQVSPVAACRAVKELRSLPGVFGMRRKTAYVRAVGMALPGYGIMPGAPAPSAHPSSGDHWTHILGPRCPFIKTSPTLERMDAPPAPARTARG